VKLICVRHGQTDWNAENRIQGHLDPELNELGIRQAKAVAGALADEHVDAIYSSDLQRAHVTAGIIAERHGLPVVLEPLLREVCLGEWQGMTIPEIEEGYRQEYAAYRRDSVANRPPGAERVEDVIERARLFIEMVLAERPEGNMIVVAHGGIIRGALCYALDSGPSLYRQVRLENAGITVLGFSADGPPHIYGMNETCHLKAMDESDNMQEL